MAKTKVALTLDSDLVNQVDELVSRRRFRSRSQAIEAALVDKLERLARTRLARESAKLNPREEKRLAEDSLAGALDSLSVDRIGQRLARASEEELARALDGLNEILG